MHISVLFHPLNGNGPVWRNDFWPLIKLFEEYFEVSFLSHPWDTTDGGPFYRATNAIKFYFDANKLSKQLINESTHKEKTLFNIAMKPSDVRFAPAIDKGNNHFNNKAIFVGENIEPDQVPVSTWQYYDRIFCFCPDLSELIEEKTGVRTIYWPPHSDILSLHSLRPQRGIDLLFMGRSDLNLLFKMQDNAIKGSSDLSVLDFVTRTNQGRTQSAEKEFRLLIDTLSRARSVACFEPSDVPRFMGRSPLLGRWIYAWMTGCVVFGTPPLSHRLTNCMDWDNSTYELPSDSKDAINFIEETLADEDKRKFQGRLNVSESMKRHDTRQRLLSLCIEFDLSPPSKLLDDLDKTYKTADRIIQAL